jgi:hypothetical protein
MSAVPLVQDDQFWLDNPSCRLVRSECEVYLDERAVASEHAEDSSVASRGTRRRIMRLRIRGIRPDDPIELKTTRWFMNRTKETPKHPRYKRTMLVLAPGLDGKRVTDVHRACPKPAPNQRKSFTPEIEPDRRAVDPDVTLVDTATTEVVTSAQDSEIVIEESPVDNASMAIVVIPEPVAEVIDPVDGPDPDLLSMIFDGEVPDKWDCCALPEGTPWVREEHASTHGMSENEELDPTDHELYTRCASLYLPLTA